MEFKSLKCVKITKSELEDIQLIYDTSSCMVDAVDRVADYLIKDNIQHCKQLPSYLVKSLARNLVMAVVNRYSYMKVID